MLNLCAFTGRLTADPELRTTQTGLSVTSFSIAVDRPFQRSGSAERVTDFFNCVAWRNTAEFISKYFKKGNLICVQGSMTTRHYEDKTGAKRIAYELVVDNAHFCEAKSSSGNNNDFNQNSNSQPSYSNNNAAPVAFESGNSGDFQIIPSDDDLPF